MGIEYSKTAKAPTIQVKYFAGVRESTGCAEETLTTARIRVVEDVLRTIRAKYDVPGEVLCAVNHEYADPDTPVKEGDEVAFFPQVTGG